MIEKQVKPGEVVGFQDEQGALIHIGVVKSINEDGSVWVSLQRGLVVGEFDHFEPGFETDIRVYLKCSAS